MNKQKYLILFSVLLLGFGFSVYQYFQALGTDSVSAVTVGTPDPGHAWSQMECSADSLCVDTVNNRLGIGTNTPTYKLDVTGTIHASGNITTSGDVCNGTGNCLSALATLTNACGGAATTYAYSATAYSGTFCVMGTSTPASPSFPAQGASTSWTCPVTSGSPVSCTATRSAAPVNGVCGPAATTYASTATAFSGALCSTGSASPASPAFPAQGSSTSWSCLGTGGGSSPSCTASRSVSYCVNGGGLTCTETVVGSNTIYKYTLSGTTTGTTTWTVPSGVSQIEYLVVAGGGGGGKAHVDTSGGGGGAGGLLTNFGGTKISVSGTANVTVGGGGAGSTTYDVKGSNGSDSSFISTSSGVSLTAIGGGGAGSCTNSGTGVNGRGNSGGSGGGGSRYGYGGSGTSGQGYDGGSSNHGVNSSGGGGAGGTATGTNNVNGGVGVSSSITGESICYAGGGGGGTYGGTAGTSSCGGGAGSATAAGTSGSVNTGGGGGGGGYAGVGGNGSPGVIIIRFVTP